MTLLRYTMAFLLRYTMAFLALTASAEVLNPSTFTSDLPSGWKHMKTALPNETLDLSIELYQPHLPALKRRLAAVSDAAHADYGQHLTKAEVEEYQVPDKHAEREVVSWLESEGINDARVDGASIRFRSSVKILRRILNADVGHYSFDQGTYLRARSYSIPLHLGAHIRFVHPLSHFARPLSSRKAPPQRRHLTPSIGVAHGDTTRRTASSVSSVLARDSAQGNESQPCPELVNPACLRRLFNLPVAEQKHTPAHVGSPDIRFAVAGFLEQWAHYDDISLFMQKFSPSIHSADFNFTVQLLNEATNPQSPQERAGIEASLDLEYAMAMGYPSNVRYYLSGGRATQVADNGTEISSEASRNEPFLEFLEYVLDLSDDDIPHVLSISYSDDENSVPYGYATKVCDMFAQVAARGVSVLVSSGNGGVSGTSVGDCFSNDGNYVKMFTPTFPPSCPYVTAVGATRSTVPLQGSMASGGGFSNYFETPDWQRQASTEYLNILNGENDHLYNVSGRAIPDLSAPGEGFSIVVGGEGTDVSGTSASTPVVAALIALVNGERLKAGKSSLGWLNPLLYTPEVREALRDVSVGRNMGCEYGNSTVPGFNAYKGYDCVTGLGSVGSFDRLLKALA